MDPRDATSTSFLNSEAEAALRLLRVDDIGQARLRALRAAFGGGPSCGPSGGPSCGPSCGLALAIDADAQEFAQAIGVGVLEAGRMQRSARAQDLTDELRVMSALGVRAVLEGDADFPELLLASHDPPLLLLVRGALESTPEAAVAIVGARRATPYGRVQAGRLAAELASRGVTVVSGGARGIDAEAHRGALRAGGRTIAVLATGFSHPYPSDHAPLFDAIVEAGGCTMTEQPAGISVRPDLFPRRNRVIAALSLVTIVVEAANRSGALLTARIAVDDLSREAGCVPGSIESPMSEGCHRAIREGWAQLVTSADDVCELMEQARTVAHGAREIARTRGPVQRPRAHGRTAAEGAAKAAELAQRNPPSVDAGEVLATIRRERRAGLDELEDVLGWSVPRIACATLELEVGRWIVRDVEGGFRELGGA